MRSKVKCVTDNEVNWKRLESVWECSVHFHRRFWRFQFPEPFTIIEFKDLDPALQQSYVYLYPVSQRADTVLLKYPGKRLNGSDDGIMTKIFLEVIKKCNIAIVQIFTNSFNKRRATISWSDSDIPRSRCIAYRSVTLHINTGVTW